MRRSSVILASALIFSITMVALVMNLPYVQALHKEGPAPIPGYLIPHPVPSNDNHAKNHHGAAEPGNNR